jgi:hypothetical protein
MTLQIGADPWYTLRLLLRQPADLLLDFGAEDDRFLRTNTNVRTTYRTRCHELRGQFGYCLSYTATMVTSRPSSSLAVMTAVQVLPSGEMTFCAIPTTFPFFFEIASA